MSAGIAFSTDMVSSAARTQAWTQAVCRSYFPLELSYRQPDRFCGRLDTWGLGAVQASRLASGPALYRRSRAHLAGSGEEDFLLTLPTNSPVRFLQMGREVECAPGGFILERSNEPYVFSYATENELIVAKIAARDLEACLPDPGRYCAICFDGEHGVGGLMHDLLRTAQARAPEFSPGDAMAVGRHLIDLLALAIKADPRATRSGETSVRRAHLQRIGALIARRHAEPHLGPVETAAACGISVRYLHDLCQSEGATFRDRLRRVRLEAARRMLIAHGGGMRITDVALDSGFCDMSSFSRAYRQAYGETPRDTRARAATPPARLRGKDLQENHEKHGRIVQRP